MKIYIFSIAVVLSLVLSTPLYAITAQETACAMVLCLHGEKTGAGGQVECNPVLAAYKKIMKIKHKKVKCAATKEMRLAKLMKCEQDEYDVEKLVDCEK